MADRFTWQADEIVIVKPKPKTVEAKAIDEVEDKAFEELVQRKMAEFRAQK